MAVFRDAASKDRAQKRPEDYTQAPFIRIEFAS